MHNDTLTWTEDGMTFTESGRQPYSNDVVISAGHVEGHPVDTLYLKLERGGHIDTFLLLRPDEVSAVIWVLSGAMWAEQIESVPDTPVIKAE